MAIKDFITETVTTLDLGHESSTVGDTKGLYKDLTAHAESRAPIMVDGEPYTIERCVARSPGEREPGPGVPYVLRHTPDGACVLELGELGHALRGLGRFLRAVGAPEDWTPIRAPAMASADGFVRGLRSSWGTEVWLSRSADLSLSLYSHQEYCSATRAIDLDVINWVIRLT